MGFLEDQTWQSKEQLTEGRSLEASVAKHAKVLIDMNTRLPEFKHGMVTSDTERQDSSHHVKRSWV